MSFMASGCFKLQIRCFERMDEGVSSIALYVIKRQSSTGSCQTNQKLLKKDVKNFAGGDGPSRVTVR